ncbi:hypothetical protein HD841_000924 [Sphingomonas melonis]|uniref:JmjC domain-containing protein n=1 Tax=Sphingomonas melonis TaxID=152682 RepID=A0A7Y9FKS9_9SPHN|nr:hypothetical protein [Sphingomonas melonis]
MSAHAVPIGELVAEGRPVILKGVLLHWPLVRHGLRSPKDAMRYLEGFYRGEPITASIAPPQVKGRFHYTREVDGLNFRIERMALGAVLDRLLAQIDDGDPPGLYVGSTDVDRYLPGLRGENDLGIALERRATNPPLVSLWLGNRTIASAHWDVLNNMACCVVGRRRFTLFPPDQIENLYPGPLELTPGGQAVSMVDFSAPDPERFPRFSEALGKAEIAELDAGDVLFFPPLWWHQVEGLGAINAMINYWWSEVPGFMDSPMDTLLHAMLSLRDRPSDEKRAWRAMFDYYIFGPPERAAAHLPVAARGALGPLDERQARQLRALLLRRLNR